MADVVASILFLTIAVLVKSIIQPPEDCGDYCIPNWLAILSSLIGIGLLLLGVGNLRQIFRDLRLPSEMRVPLTDATLDMKTVNKFANSCQVREKGLKILQYVLRTGAYSAVFSKAVSSQLKGLAKTTSVARRFFKFCRWVKHFEDFSEAKEQKGVMRVLFYTRIGANFGADWAEDTCSLERIGVLPKGTLSVEFMLFAEYCQLVLALVEVVVTSAKLRKEEESAGAAPPPKAERKLALVRLEVVKYVSDIGKALFDCELSIAHEGVFICCSLFSAVVSTHKNMVKVLK